MTDGDQRIAASREGGAAGPRSAERAAPSVALVAIAALVTIAALALGAAATITGDQPPASGDWVVRNLTVVNGETVALAGSLVVESDLTILDSTILLAPSTDGALEVNLTPAGELTVKNSRLASSTGAGYTFVVRGPLDASNSTFENCSGGVRVATAARVRVTDCAILEPTGAALVMEGADDATLARLRVVADGWVDTFSRAAEARGRPLVEVEPVVVPGIVLVTGGRPVLRGLDISVNRTVEGSLRLDVRTDCATFAFRVETYIIEASGGASMDIEGLVLRDSRTDVNISYDHHVYVAEAFTTITVSPHLTMVRAVNCPDVRVSGGGLRAVFRQALVASFRTDQPEPVLFDSIDGHPNPLVLDHLVDATYSGAGPHRIRASVEGFNLNATRVMRSDIRPRTGGAGRVEVVADLFVANATVRGCTRAVELRLRPSGSTGMDLDATFRVSDCAFDRCYDDIVLYQANPGTHRSFEEAFTIERCTFSNSSAGERALVATGIPGAPQRHQGMAFTLRGCTFVANTGQLVDLYCGWVVKGIPQTAVVDNCTFRDNWGLRDGYLVTIDNWDVTVVSNSTFVNNRFNRALRLFDLGGINDDGDRYSKPSDFSIRDCTFERNVGDAIEGERPEVLAVTWSGSLRVASNHLGRSDILFLNASEYINVTKQAMLTFQGNDVHNRSGPVVMLTVVDRMHTALSVLVRDNVVEDCTAPLLDYPHAAPEVRIFNWDARIDIINNTARRCAGPVFWCYGDLNVTGNAFAGCTGYPVTLDNLWQHQPVLERNSFVACTDCMWVGAKQVAPALVLMFVYDTEVNCTGTAYRLFRMEANFTRCNVTGAESAVVAEESVVDALDCRLDVGSGSIVWFGTIRVWFDVEARVEWGNATGAASGNPVPGAMVSAYDRNGTFATSRGTGADGRTGSALRLLQWYMDLFAAELTYEVLSPYNLTATCASLKAVAVVDVNRSLRGGDAVKLVIGDPFPPTVVILEPVDGAILNVTDLRLVGYCEDPGSGTYVLELDWGGGGPVRHVLAGETEFDIALPFFPEGVWTVVAKVYDLGLNEAVDTVSITVDRTPPRLVVLEPADGTLTNKTSVTLRAEVEPGTRVWVDLMEMDPSVGTIETDVRLNEGLNTIVLRSVDDALNEARVALHIWLDTVAPELEVVDPRDGLVTGSDVVPVEGYVTGQDHLTVTARQGVRVITEVAVEPGDRGDFRLTVQLPEGVSTIEVRAWDEARNTVRVLRTVTVDTTPPEAAILSPEDGLVTNQGLIVVRVAVAEDAEQAFLNGRVVLGRGTVEQQVLLEEGANRVSLRALDILGNERVVSIDVTLDTVAPAVVITSPAREPHLTNDATVVVEGTATGAASVTVDGAPAAMDGDAFTAVVTLPRDGTHTIVVVALDVAGNRARLSFSVVLDTVAAPLSLTFEPPGDVVRGEGGALRVRGVTDATAVRAEVVLNASGTEIVRAIDLAGNMTFEHVLQLARGENTVVVRLWDVYGNLNVSAPRTVTYTPDGGGPQGPVVGTGSLALIVLAVAIAAVLVAVMLVRHRRGHSRGGSSRE